MLGNLEKPQQFEFYTQVLIRTYRDMAALCSHRSSSIDKDVKTLIRRTAAEGMGFLTESLPSLGKCLDKTLSSDVLMPNHHSFEKSKKSWGAPVFLSAFWRQIFSDDGTMYEDSSGPIFEAQVKAVRAVRQICFLFYKLECTYTPEKEAEVLSSFETVDISLPHPESLNGFSDATQRALESARMLIWYVLKDFDPLDITPRHGPGAVATGEKAWEKISFSRFYEQLDKVYSYPEYFFFNHSHLCDTLEDLEGLEVKESSMAKVILVPKDSRGPRLISEEPLEIQWIQQGLMKKLYQFIEDPSKPCSGYVNVTNQEINRKLALDNSFDSDIITVDMKEASDRVSLRLVKTLFPPHVSRAFEACRSGETKLPCGRSITLRKFAPMGSAVCFPVEALIFWALAVGSVRDVYSASHLLTLPDLYVYGDDMICSRADYSRFRPVFEELSLQFNEDKCCTGRFFRESCGLDAFKLNEVNPVRVKTLWGEKLSPAASVSWIAVVNRLLEKGLSTTADYIRGQLISKLGTIPVTNRSDALPHTFCYRNWSDNEVFEYNFSHFPHRYNKRLQKWEIKLKVPRPPSLRRGEPGWPELFHRYSPQDRPDPFGINESYVEPCCYTVPHQQVMRWSWVDLYSLLSGQV